MNAYAGLAGPIVRSVDADDGRECARIDRFLIGHPRATLFHRPAWVRAVAAGTGHAGRFLVAERGRAIVGLLPVTEIRSRLFGSALVSSGFGVGGGILADDEQTIRLLARAAIALASKSRCGSVELRGGPVPDGFAAETGNHAGFARDLADDDEALLKAIPRKQRAEVRRAQSLGLAVSVGRGPNDRRAHHAVYAESVRNLGTPVFPRSLFDTMIDFFGDNADILTVRADGRPVASVLSFYFKGCVYPYWGGGTRAARSLRANELMYFELMRHAVRRGCIRFDFGRSKVGTGAFAYKKNWGFEPEPLTYARYSTDGAEPRTINPLDPKYRLRIEVWKRLPLWVANRIGPIIARGLG